MKRVLVPIDFSDEARYALVYAQVLFADVPCKFFLLNAHVSYRTDVLSEEFNDYQLYGKFEESKDQLKLVMNEVKKAGTRPEHQFETVVIASTLVDAIKCMAKTATLDYIIMANKGTGHLKEIFLGNSTVSVINEVDCCPIIVVPKNYKIDRLKQIVFSTNFKRAIKKEELRPMLGLARLWKLKIKIVQIMSESELNASQKLHKETLGEMLAGLDHFFHQIKVYTSETDAIMDFAQHTESDMISLVNHKYNFLRKLLQENVVKQVTFNSPVPILILQDED